MSKFASYNIVAVLLLAAVIQPAYANIRFFCLYELAEQSDVVFVGTVTALTKDTAAVTVSEMLSGKLEADEVSATPIQIRSCTGLIPSFSIDRQFLIFGTKSGKKSVTVAAEGFGAQLLYPETRQTEIAAARRILEIAKLDEHAKNKAMLDAATSDNKRLRFEASHYIVSVLSNCQQRDAYKDDLLSLVRDTDPQVQWAGLKGIQFIHDPNVIGLLIERTGSKDKTVVSAASMALAQYDMPKSTAALIALTQHADPDTRIRAAIDLDNNITQPEAKEALRALLDDEDPRVRAAAPRRFVEWLRRGQADDVLGKLVEMLNDEEPKVCGEAAHALGECRNSQLVPPLLKALKKYEENKDVQWMILNALYCHYSKGDKRAKELIDNEIDFVVKSLTEADADYRSSFNAVGILDLSPKEEAAKALKWAGEHHAHKDIRAYARRCLSR